MGQYFFSGINGFHSFATAQPGVPSSSSDIFM